VAFSLSTLPRAAVMGIVNVTPDSFSDGGEYATTGAAVDHGLDLVAAGAAIVDIGGESTRPGAEPVTAAVEHDRVVPVIAALAGAFGARGAVVSVDTTKASVADAALAAGAQVVNDISAARFDGEMLGVVAAHDAGIVLMHIKGEPRTMQHDPRYDDVVAEVGDHLAERVDAALAAGIRRDAILVDPGIGFGKTMAHNLALLAHLEDLRTRAGAPLVVGASRKRFLGAIIGEGADVDTAARDDATLATTVHSFARGARVVRVHDVAPSVHAARLLALLDEQRDEPDDDGASR
jgi:dihydropteroate synthase